MSGNFLPVFEVPERPGLLAGMADARELAAVDRAIDVYLSAVEARGTMRFAGAVGLTAAILRWARAHSISGDELIERAWAACGKETHANV